MQGVRIKESIILPGCKIDKHSCIVNSIIGWNTKIGTWNHIEGVIEKINPNQKHSIFESENNVYFTEDGTMKKIVTIIGHDVTVRDETSIYSSLILPGKDINYSIKNQIVL
jgi:mannose-1-phosphate guanylyltransferase